MANISSPKLISILAALSICAHANHAILIPKVSLVF